MFAVTGATGHLGQLVISHLLNKNIKPQDIVAIVRDAAKAQTLIDKGIIVREANYNSQDALQKAFLGVDKVLLISGNEFGERFSQHQNVINAAKSAKVKHILYTSILNADKSKMQLAVDHLATEKAIRASGMNFTFLRNSWYIENYTEQLSTYLQYGSIAGSAKNGKVSAATRSDYAEAAAMALTQNSSENAVYELAGAAFTLNELALAISEATGKQIVYHDLPVEEYTKVLISAHLPEAFAKVLADSDLGIVRGDLYSESQDLAKILGRTPTTVPQVLKTMDLKVN